MIGDDHQLHSIKEADRLHVRLGWDQYQCSLPLWTNRKWNKVQECRLPLFVIGCFGLVNLHQGMKERSKKKAENKEVKKEDDKWVKKE